MKNIYTYVAKDGYAARVQDTKSYDAIRFVDFPISCSADSCPPPLAKTYFRDGHSLLSLTTITRARTRTNIGEETNISLGITLLSYRGMP